MIGEKMRSNRMQDLGVTRSCIWLECRMPATSPAGGSVSPSRSTYCQQTRCFRGKQARRQQRICAGGFEQEQKRATLTPMCCVSVQSPIAMSPKSHQSRSPSSITVSPDSVCSPAPPRCTPTSGMKSQVYPAARTA